VGHGPPDPSLGVANIDVLKRSHVTSVIERAIDELLKHELEIARDSLARPSDKSEFGYGHVCGMFQALQLARSILEHCLNEGDPVRERREES
jgi:hypothetical protein